ncbi:hypothetical protein [Enterobacter phage EspM4VN]|uniref:Uncharacterized protein n=1 Tax=Enterobacter phage EspM4VN TaxID=2137745 RepID=A0A4P2WVF5_9CAUD|nr:hypothetical protein HYP11_gp131 [Enterobacter phage EspM4VN]BBK03816.1 hypothetical protein [Enterobacter phage EspM4VN]
MSKPSFLQFMQEKDQLDEAFNSAPYELTMGKKNAGDVFFTFIDEDEKEYRIQFYTPQGLGKNVRQVFIGQKRGSVYPDAIARFKNPMRVIASMIEATKQFLATPLGKTIDGYAVNFSKKALDRGMTLIPKIIRQSGLKQKLNVMDLTYAPVPDRGYVWLVRKGKDPAQVFDGPKMQGITWDDPDKVGDVPVQSNAPDVGASSNNPDWNISVMAKSNGIFSSVVKVVGANDVTLSSNDLAIMVKDGAMAKIARTQTIAQVTVFNKEYVGRGEVDRKIMAMSDRQGMGWELKSGGKIVAYVEFGVGAVAPVQTTAAELTTDRWRALVNAFYKVNELRGVSSSTMASGSVSFGAKGAVTATINRGIRKEDDPVVLTVKAITEYGPNGKTIGQPIVIRDIDITKPSKLTAIVQTAIDRLAPLVLATTKKTGVDLATYAGSIRDNAPKGRDLDWQIYASRDGQTLNVDWDITFRRNTTEGAFREFKAQIDRANQYLQTLYQDAKSKGYNPTEPNLMTLARAQQSDEWAASNGESAYSEYEQSLGGNMQIKI